jgi:cell division protein FtsQ
MRGARNWTTAQLRAASYSRRGFWRLVLSMVALIGFLLFLGLWMAGLLPTVRQSITDTKRNTLMAMGFQIERVDVIGEGRLDERAVRRALGAWPGDYAFDLDMDAAQARVQSLPWVEHVVVRRLWPDRIVVQIIEKRPYALWQDGGTFKLVDARGDVIGAEDAVAVYKDAIALPHIVGPDANLAFAALEESLTNQPELTSRLRSSVYVGDRWDLITVDGLRIQLPSQNTDHAIATLADLQARTQILDREIATIDLRLPDRITIAPATDSAA